MRWSLHPLAWVTTKNILAPCVLLFGGLLLMVLGTITPHPYPGFAASHELYVDSSAALGGNGSFLAPFKTIQAALNVATPGNTVVIRGDVAGSGRVYPETPSFPVSGSSALPITVKGYQGEIVIISHASTILFNKNYIILENLIIDHQNVAGDAIKWGGNNNIFKNSELRNGQREGIDFDPGVTNALIENSKIHDFKWITTTRNDAHCIVSDPKITNLTIRNNTIYDCSGDGYQAFAGTAMFPPNASDGILIEGNTIYSTLGPNMENAIDLKDGVNITVRNNTLHGFTANKAIVVQKYHDNVVIQDNVIYNSEQGIEVRMEDTTTRQNNITIAKNLIRDINITTAGYAIKFDGVTNGNIYNNTIAKSPYKSIFITGVGLSGGNIKNNLVYNSGGASSSGMSGVSFSNNGWFNSSAGNLSGTGDMVGTDPQFMNAATNNYDLSSTSPVIDKGINVGYAFSGPAPDLGMFEFGSAGPPPPDTVAPTISGITTNSLTSSGVTVTWTTDEPSDTQIEYGLTASYGLSTALTTTLLTSHSQILSGLSASTLYHYRVKSRDAAGNLAISGDFMFTTSAATLPPASITATIETTPIPHTGDAADDPAIWVNASNPSQSTIVGTDKLGGIAVYDLAGNQLQYLPDGNMNNVDLRYNFPLGGQNITLVTAGNRTNNSIALYKVNPTTRLLENIAARTITTVATYGSCMYRSAITGKYYYFVNAVTGVVEQWELFDNGAGLVDATMVRTFDVGSQPEGCVADDAAGQFYIGEELVGIWRYGAEPSTGTARMSVASTGTTLVADVEGLTIAYNSDSTKYLFASSQGDSSFVIYAINGDTYTFVKKFQIVNGIIDGATGTDGIDVSTMNLGAAFPQGVFVAQDGSNDVGNQNYKLVPLNTILDTLPPPPAPGCVTSSTSWQNTGITSQAGTFTFEFDATPQSAGMNGIVGLSSGPAADYTGLAVGIRFWTSGMIEAYNGTGYPAGTIPYTPSTSYHFRLVINIPNHTYSAYVTPLGSLEQTLATNYAFRSTQNAITSLNTWALYAALGTHRVCNTTITGSVAPPPPPPLPAGTYLFAAGGDHSAGTQATASVDTLATLNPSFYLALGDMSYGSPGTETTWCNFIKSKFMPPFQVVTGNHEDHDGVDDNGSITNFAACLPDRMSSLGTYGTQYYFDFQNLARIIMISPNLTINGIVHRYTVGSSFYTWLSTALDDARTKNIPWVIVGMHENCITMGTKTCEISSDLFNLLVAKKVDLVLQAHDHTYQRSKQLAHSGLCSAIATGSYNSACVSDNGADNAYLKNNGPVLVISGTFGRTIYDINTADTEAGYFAKWMGNNINPTYGFVKYTISSTQLAAQFVGTSSGTFTDSFTITASSDTTPPAIPSNVQVQ